MARLIVSGISFEGRHGATAAERRSQRRFEVNVQLDTDVASAEASDRLSDTIDFQKICEVVVTLGTGEPHHLLESLARKMADAVVACTEDGVCTLELRKLAPPYCIGNPTYAAVEVTARKSSI